MLMIKIPLPHYDNFATTFRQVEKKCVRVSNFFRAGAASMHFANPNQTSWCHPWIYSSIIHLITVTNCIDCTITMLKYFIMMSPGRLLH